MELVPTKISAGTTTRRNFLHGAKKKNFCLCCVQDLKVVTQSAEGTHGTVLESSRKLPLKINIKANEGT